MSHPLLTQHPAYLAHEEKVAELEQARSVWQQRTRRIGEEYQAQLAEHRQATRAALLNGQEPPPEPAPPTEGSPDQARVFLDQDSALRAARRDLLADLASEVEDAAVRREREIADEARPQVEALRRPADEAAALVAAVRMVRLPAERRDGIPAGDGLAHRMRSRVTVADLVTAVLDGSSLFDPIEPVPLRMVAARFEPPPEEEPSRPSPMRDRSPSPLQVKGT